jgi:hypothetical protein
MGDIYDWANLHPELTRLQVNYEDAIAVVVGNPALSCHSGKSGKTGSV